MSLADMRRDYQQNGLREEDLVADPIRQFQVWMDVAIAAELPEPNAMTLATATLDGRPSARMVLLKEIDQTGFVFFTNYLSRKGQEIAANPYVALVVFWVELERQIRIEGRIAPLAAAASDAYFHSRPRGSQLGSAASPQSQVVTSRDDLELRVQHLSDQYPEQIIPRPSHWGGYHVTPATIEFWQGRTNRLHDRLRYRRATEADPWQIERLAP